MQASPRRISAQIRVSAARIYATEQLDPDETRAEVAARLALRQFQRSAGSVANADVVSCHLVFVSDDAQLEAVVVNIEARQARLAAAASGYIAAERARARWDSHSRHADAAYGYIAAERADAGHAPGEPLLGLDLET